MVARGEDGIFRTQPVETHSNGDGNGALPVAATDIMDAEGSARWNAWWDQRFAVENENWCQTIARCLDEYCRPFEQQLAAQAKQIRELELKLASALGAIDILRGKGAPGSFNVRGTYDPGTLYRLHDVVALNGGSFIALRDRPGPCPGADWQLLCSRGGRGVRGERGPQGPRGGDGPMWRWLSFDSEKLALTVTLSDGSAGPKIPLRGIFTDVHLDPATYSIKFVMADGAELAFSLRGLFAQFFDELKGR